MAWHTLNGDETAAKLDADPHNGLSTVEAAQLLQKSGPTALAEKAKAPY